jgi:hypothetical protein
VTAARTRSPGGVALVFVLATIALVVPPCVALARAVTTVQIERQVRTASALASDVVTGAETICLRWLRNESEKVVLPPDAMVPAVAVADERFVVADREVTVRIVAWDQCGLVPADLAAGASPTKLVLPNAIARAGEFLSRAGAPRGLDQLATVDGSASAFPEVDLGRESEAGGLKAVVKSSTLESPGAWIGVRPLAKDGSPAAINVHTARKDVLDAALRDAGRGGLDAILAARADGRQAALAGAGTGGNDAAGNASVVLVSTSDTWAFRIDVTVGAVRESWWVVFARDGGGFKRAQRLFIPD